LNETPSSVTANAETINFPAGAIANFLADCALCGGGECTNAILLGRAEKRHFFCKRFAIGDIALAELRMRAAG
jgi:hypothetical protein